MTKEGITPGIVGPSKKEAESLTGKGAGEGLIPWIPGEWKKTIGVILGITGMAGAGAVIWELAHQRPAIVEPITATQIPPASEISGVPELTFEQTVTPESKLFFQENFETLENWDVYPRGGKVWLEDGLNLEAPFGSTFPVVERKDVFPAKGSFELNAKLSFPEKKGYGTYFWLLDENDKSIFSVNGGECANRFIRAALNNGKEVNPFVIFSNENYDNGWDGSLGNADIPHQVSFYYDSEKETGYLALDETYVLELSDLPRPIGVRMGNPATTTDSGAWTTMEVEFLEVRQSLEPSFIIPKEPPPYELALFKEIDGQEIKEISTLDLPPGDNWAVEVKATFSNFSVDKPAWIQIGELEVVGAKGWESFLALSAGKEGERFGEVIYPDVGKPVEGRECLRRPKELHTFRLVRLGDTEYLYVIDKKDNEILVGQGPVGEVRREISVEFLEETGGTKMEIDNVKLFSVTP